VGLSGSGQEETPVGALLFDILVCFLNGNAERIFSRRLVEELNGIGERPWAELRQGKGITEVWLARQLRPYGVLPKTMWIGESAAKGYLKEDFEGAFERYIPKSQAKAMLKELATLIKPPGNAQCRAGETRSEECGVRGSGCGAEPGKGNGEPGK
jgi:hypothetical protein